MFIFVIKFPPSPPFSVLFSVTYSKNPPFSLLFGAVAVAVKALLIAYG
jgi:hypothetical protein